MKIMSWVFNSIEHFLIICIILYRCIHVILILDNKWNVKCSRTPEGNDFILRVGIFVPTNFSILSRQIITKTADIGFSCLPYCVFVFAANFDCYFWTLIKSYLHDGLKSTVCFSLIFGKKTRLKLNSICQFAAPMYNFL